jgi:EmrB/QacA subfamily drug resistance transporter
MTVASPPSRDRWWTLGVVSLGTFMLLLDLSVVAIALPQIHSSLGASFAQLQWVVDAYSLTLAAFLVTSGSLGDRGGRKKLFQAGFVVFTASSLACGLAGSATALDVSRGFQGVGAAMLFAIGPSLLGNAFHGKERAMAFSVFGAATGLAIAAGPLIGGALTNAESWRWIFYINVPVGVVAMAITQLKVPESKSRRAHPVDWAGMITFSVALSALAFAVIRGNDRGWTDGLILSLFAVAVVFLAVFVAIEARLGERAMIDLGLFRNVTFLGISLVALIGNASALPSIFVLTNYLENLLHSSAWSTGLRFLPLTLSLFFFAALGGGLIGKIPFNLLMGFAALFLAVGLALIQRAGADSSWTALIPAMVVMGIGFGIFNPTRAALAIGITEPARSGIASGINETFQQVGTAVGIAGIGAFFQNRVASVFASGMAGSGMDSTTAHAVGRSIAAGNISQAASASGQAGSSAVLSTVRNSFVAGFHDAMWFCAAIALASSLVAFFMLRQKDLHSSALSLIPPEVDEEDEPEVLVGTAG